MPFPPAGHGPASAVAAAAPFTGRDRELTDLRAVLADVAGGTPVAAVISGPFGIGKTRLAREALAVFAATGFRPLRGQAQPLAPAYGLLTSALRPYLHGREGEALAELVRDLPQLALLFGGLPVEAPPALGVPELERARLEDGLATLLERLAREQPLALMLDDLHRADRGSLSVLQVVVAALSDLPVVLLVTVATDAATEPATGDGVHGGIDSLRAPMAESGWRLVDLELGPLDDRDGVALVRHLAPRHVPSTAVRDVVQRCAGRPLFLEALGGGLADAAAAALDGDAPPDRGLPRGVRAQVRERLRAVGRDGRGVLELLAVAGGELDHVVLEQASGLSHDPFVQTLGQLVQRHMVNDRPGGDAYDLAHGVLREALLQELSTLATRRLHAALVGALQELRPADPTVAEHVLAAMPLIAPGEAVRLLVDGGERASRVGATDEAIRWLTGAVDLARQQGDLTTQARALTVLGTLLSYSGSIEGARSRWGEGLAVCGELGDPVGAARIHRELGMLAWADGNPGESEAQFQAADDALAGLEQSPEHAELLYARMVNAVRTGDTAVVREVAARLRSLADELGSPSLTARAELSEAATAFAATDYVVMGEINQRALVAAEASGDPQLIIRAHDQLSITAATQGDVDGLRRHSEASLEVARKVGARLLEAWPRLRLAAVDLLSGQWDSALRGTAEVVALAERTHQTRGFVSSSAAHAWVLAHRGRLVEARDRLDSAMARARPALEGDRNIYNMVRLADASLALVEGRPEHARRAATHLDDLTGGWLPLLCAAVLGETHVACGDLDAARDLARTVRGVRSCSTVLPQAVGGWLEGLADVAEARTDGLDDLLGGAATAYDQLGLPFHAGRALLAWAGGSRDREAAARRAGRALVVFESLGAPVQAQEARSLLRGLGVVPARGRVRGNTVGGLSPRELEVARLVATGLSNADVATRLFISPRTVSTHLDHVYRRLGLSSRVSLTRYLADSGLLESAAPESGVTASGVTESGAMESGGT